MAKFSTPALSIIFTNDEGQEVTIERIQTIAADQFAYDMIRRNTPNFPSHTEAPLLWCYVLAFNALKRTGQIGKEHRFDTWIEEHLLSADVLREQADDAAPLAA
ncbi:hypothetical protein E4U03_10975 [Rothia nasimurium]|uniref:Uncharacterized protein n=1 Tax=Rothia nasimurium TaxID=85336 RepID=A0A4Y9F0R5_9MICC|nr:hypothetical protein [Rothia nasimurium]MBF0809121.1 hypothetical protein [Rothia nasimurium]TFU20643.1 hypothetical protein E4U03_10975 [Rothia nasimurium]